MVVHDMDLALKRAAGRAELAAELHGMLVQSCVETKALIEQSWCRGNRRDLLNEVHKLNGSTRYCGVPQLESCAENLELLLKRGEGDVEGAYAALIQALERILVLPVPFQA